MEKDKRGENLKNESLTRITNNTFLHMNKKKKDDEQHHTTTQSMNTIYKNRLYI